MPKGWLGRKRKDWRQKHNRNRNRKLEIWKTIPRALQRPSLFTFSWIQSPGCFKETVLKQWTKRILLTTGTLVKVNASHFSDFEYLNLVLTFILDLGQERPNESGGMCIHVQNHSGVPHDKEEQWQLAAWHSGPIHTGTVYTTHPTQALSQNSNSKSVLLPKECLPHCWKTSFFERHSDHFNLCIVLGKLFPFRF
jgi:hypothetical protein